MRKLIVYFLWLCCSTLFAQSKKLVYEDKLIKAEYHTKNGLLDGTYISHYANGKKKAEGHFKENLRVGKWSIWDSTGKTHIEHIFKADSLIKNKHGYVTYTVLKEEDVMVAKRVWRNVYKDNNPLLFTGTLFDTLYNYIQRDSLSVFKDEEFATPRSKKEIENVFSSEKFDVVALKIKEDWFFDKKKNAAEIRIMGIYPVLRPKNSEGEENMGLGWIYFPQVRKILAAQKITDKHIPSITNLDELFWYRHFVSQIYKENNVFDRPIASYAKTTEEAAKEAERIEIDIIELEHNVWLYGDKLFMDSKTK